MKGTGNMKDLINTYGANPFNHIVWEMADQLIDHINKCGDGSIRFYSLEGYQQSIVDHTIALIRIARLKQQWRKR